MQHVRELRRPQSLSGRAPPKLVFSWEPFSAIVRQIAPLFTEHWRELALNQDTIPLEPDYERYLACERAGVLHVMTVRDRGNLVGYVFCIIGPHLHYVSTLWCFVDMFWLEPAYRKGFTGVRMLKAFEQRMRDLKVHVIHATEKHHFKNGRVGAIFEFLGYAPIETVYSKRIG